MSLCCPDACGDSFHDQGREAKPEDAIHPCLVLWASEPDAASTTQYNSHPPTTNAKYPELRLKNYHYAQKYYRINSKTISVRYFLHRNYRIQFPKHLVRWTQGFGNPQLTVITIPETTRFGNHITGITENNSKIVKLISVTLSCAIAHSPHTGGRRETGFLYIPATISQISLT